MCFVCCRRTPKSWSFADVYDDVQKKKKQKEEKEKPQKKHMIKGSEAKKEDKTDKKKSSSNKDGDKDISFTWWLITGLFSLLFSVFSFVFPALSSLLRSLFGSKSQKESNDDSSSSAPSPGGQAKSPSVIEVNPFADDPPQSPKYVQRLLQTRARYPHSPFTPGPR